MHRLLLAALPLSLALGCPGAEPVFPADVEESFTEVRDCRTSIEHELHHIRVFVDEVAHDPYEQRDVLFPPGATVVKIEYEDDGCTELIGYTAMRKLAEGEGEDALGWHWQETDPDRVVLEDGALERCIRCHRACDDEGHDSTCAEP